MDVGERVAVDDHEVGDETDLDPAERGEPEQVGGWDDGACFEVLPW